MLTREALKNEIAYLEKSMKTAERLREQAPDSWDRLYCINAARIAKLKQDLAKLDGNVHG